MAKYKFSIVNGNNGNLVRTTFGRRPWWTEIDPTEDGFDFHWREVRNREIVDKVKKNGKKQFLNHHEGQESICRKSELYRNLKMYFASQSRNVHDIVPQTYIISVGEHTSDYNEFLRHCKALEQKKDRSGSCASSESIESAGGSTLSSASTIVKQRRDISPSTRVPATQRKPFMEPRKTSQSPLKTLGNGSDANNNNNNEDGEAAVASPREDNNNTTVEAELSPREEERMQARTMNIAAAVKSRNQNDTLKMVAKGTKPPMATRPPARAPPSSSITMAKSARNSNSIIINKDKDNTAGTILPPLSATMGPSKLTSVSPSKNMPRMGSSSVLATVTASSGNTASTTSMAKGNKIEPIPWGSNGSQSKISEAQKKKALLSSWAPGKSWNEKQEANNLWIVKPTNLNRGQGIQVLSGLKEVENHLSKKKYGYTAIVQKYIERPLLIGGRKFDIRQLVFVDHKMRVYRYNRPYVRLSSTRYDTENLSDRFVHLTNYSVQKYSTECNAYEEGNNIDFPQLQEYLDQNHANAQVNVDRDLITSMEDIIVDTQLAVRNKLNPFHDGNTFQIYGYDFLIDEDFKVWLLEINTNPYIGFSSKMLAEIFTGMMEGVFRITVDTNFPPPPGQSLPPMDIPGADGWLPLSLDKPRSDTDNTTTTTTTTSVTSSSITNNVTTTSSSSAINSTTPASNGSSDDETSSSPSPQSS